MKTLDFWKNNKKDQHFSLSSDELKTKFFAWMKTKERSWLEYYGSFQSYVFFVADELQSVSDDNQKHEFVEAIRDDFWKSVEEMANA